MKLTKEHYQEMHERGHLNGDGLSYLIDIHEGKIKDNSPRIKEVAKEKGLHNDDIDDVTEFERQRGVA